MKLWLKVIYLKCIYEWQEDHPFNIQTKAISLTPQYTNYKNVLQTHVSESNKKKSDYTPVDKKYSLVSKCTGWVRPHTVAVEDVTQMYLWIYAIF